MFMALYTLFSGFHFHSNKASSFFIPHACKGMRCVNDVNERFEEVKLSCSFYEKDREAVP